MEQLQTLQDYLPLILRGAWVTIQISVASLLLASLLGVLAALGKLAKNPVLHFPLDVYTTLIRGVPDLILMLLIYYGGQILLNDFLLFVGYEEYVEIEPFLAGVLTIGFIFGAYMCETFRGAILSVKRGEIEASQAYGLNSFQTFHRIIFPQMVIHAVPGFFNNWQVLLKSTALVSIIGLEDVVRKAKLAGDTTKMPFTFLFAGALIYLLITSLSILAIRWLERKFPMRH